MSKDIDPFADDLKGTPVVDADATINNRLGMSSVRQALSRWWIMLIFGVLGYVGALYYMSIKPPTNEAVAVLEVELKQRKQLGEELSTDRTAPEIALATVASKIMGPAILAEVANSPEVQALQSVVPPKFSLTPRYWRTEDELAFRPASAVETYELVDMMVKGWVTISARRNTSLIDVRVKHQDPDSARVIADTLLRVFVEKEEAKLSTGSDSFLKTLKIESEAASLSMKQAEKSLQVYVSALKLNEQIREKRAEVISLRQRYLPKHPLMQQEEAVYADLLQRFTREIKRSSAAESEKAHWLDRKEQMAALEQEIEAGGPTAASASDEWLAIAQNSLSSRANLLNSTIEHSKQSFATLTRRMTEIDVADDTALNKYDIVEPAFIGIAKDSVRLIYLAAGSILGIFAGFGVAYALGVIDYKIYDVRSAEEATGLTCMAAVPSSSMFTSKGAWESILSRDPNSPNSESIRNLRASMILLGKQERNKLILVTSSIPGEGKTTISAEMAAAFALNKERTLLIDMDLRRPRLTETFPALKDKPGIVDVLAGQTTLEKVFHDTDIPLLTVIGSGSKCPNPSELLHEGDFIELLDRLRPQFDRIILDSAPVLPVSDTRLMAKHMQTVVLVVRSRKTPVGAMVRARNLLDKAGGRVAGVVVNGMKRGGNSGGFNGYKGYGEYGSDDYGYYGKED